MSASELPEPVAATNADPAAPEANGHPTPNPPSGDPRRERFRLRAQCAKLRHWCRDLLTAAGTEGALPETVVRELESNPPAMSFDEVFAALRIISQGEPLPPSDEPAPADESALRQEVAALAAERERLRQVFFTLHDAAFPDDVVTEDYILEQIERGPLVALDDVITDLEREFGGDN